MPKVLRRNAYKGTTALTHVLPIDAVSTIGIVAVLGTVLPASCLSAAALDDCKSILQTLEGNHPVTEFEATIPRGRSIKIEASSNGKFKLDQLKPLWKKLGLNFQRQDI